MFDVSFTRRSASCGNKVFRVPAPRTLSVEFVTAAGELAGEVLYSYPATNPTPAVPKITTTAITALDVIRCVRMPQRLKVDGRARGSPPAEAARFPRVDGTPIGPRGVAVPDLPLERGLRDRPEPPAVPPDVEGVGEEVDRPGPQGEPRPLDRIFRSRDGHGDLPRSDSGHPLDQPPRRVLGILGGDHVAHPGG